MRENNMRFPNILKHNLEIVLNKELERFFKSKSRNLRKVKQVAKEIKQWNVEIYKEQLMEPASQHLMHCLYTLEHEEYNIKSIERITEIITICDEIGVRLWRRRLQNLVFKLSNKFIKNVYASPKVTKSHKWQLALLDELCNLLGVKITGISVLMKV